jgi:hypothetical protein
MLYITQLAKHKETCVSRNKVPTNKTFVQATSMFSTLKSSVDYHIYKSVVKQMDMNEI